MECRLLAGNAMRTGARELRDAKIGGAAVGLQIAHLRAELLAKFAVRDNFENFGSASTPSQWVRGCTHSPLARQVRNGSMISPPTCEEESTMKTGFARATLAALMGVAFLSGSVFAADQKPAAGMSEPSKAMRENMARLHEQMAVCLRSDKTIAKCRDEMRQHCQSMMGGRACPMMDMGMVGMGGHGGMMNPPPGTQGKQ